MPTGGPQTLKVPPWEAAGYVLVVAAAFQQVLSRGMQLSAEFDGGGVRRGTLRGLAPGWLFGRSMDLSDIQWRVFRENLPLLTLALCSFAAAGCLVRRVWPSSLTSFYLVSSGLYVGYLHGCASFFAVSLVLVNFGLTVLCAGKPFCPAVVWAFNCSALMTARIHDGFTFQSISAGLAFLDSHRGAQRWHICFNMVILRCISFSMDYHSAVQCAAEKAQGSPAKPKSNSSKKGTEAPALPLSEYNWRVYLAYVFYPPLYVAGPIMGFNSFASQLLSRSRPPLRDTAVYVLRWAASFLLLEAMSHVLYFNAIAKHRVWARWKGDHPLAFRVADVGITGFWVLNFMWLKFLVIWRYFRAIAMLEGIQAPENMLRCVNNNYNIEGFWRSWHASYNRWLVRYLYVPLGGSSRKFLTIWAVFTFVALWHDIEWRMVSWAWLMCLFFAPELIVKWAVAQPWANRDGVKSSAAYRHLAALGATCNISMLMTINLLGFVTGVDGIFEFLSALLSSGSTFIALTLITFYSSAQLMFAIRDWERRRSAQALRTE